MKKSVLIVQIITVILFLFACSNDDDSSRISATVLRAVDGDTIEVQLKNGEKEKVRMILIDTPETKHPQLGVQPFGEEASEFTKKMLVGKKIELELDVSERDRYGRVLAYVWIEGINFNRLLVETGYARVAIFPPDIKYVDDFEEAQDKARQEAVGIWSIENYVHDKGFKDSEQEVSKQVSEVDEKCKIKGNINSKKEKIYHLPSGQYYEQVIPEQWFCTEEEAQEAGFRASKR
ncbi:thermonuclease family protein [Bacillus sp. FJAT-50079]|uniref:thermonuclease family protein n=1 Tax=Bacillus sp. FJAT-50079 TaxID=2833577 RepID=UPI001BC97BC7|nr:thermonuclease family protein [Bacillus sp. FJAT-50079]MBS4207420.1 thermonuclease family protein [Bacillus sp. FJAT-50079]